MRYLLSVLDGDAAQAPLLRICAKGPRVVGRVGACPETASQRYTLMMTLILVAGPWHNLHCRHNLLRSAELSQALYIINPRATRSQTWMLRAFYT